MSYSIHQVTQNSAFQDTFNVTFTNEDGTINYILYGAINTRKGRPIVHFGYNCELNGTALQYPLYVGWDVEENLQGAPATGSKIYVGKTGIYEAEYGDDMRIFTIAFPLCVRFTCDYVTVHSGITDNS